MDTRSYTNFDLVIEQAGDKYRARVVNSPAGQAATEFDSLFSPLELENFVLRMGRPQRGMRRIDSTEMESVKTFGARLFRTVFNDDVYACYLRSLDDALDENKGLRIRLRIDVPQFHDLPWEFLYNRQIDQFLALSKDTPVVRYIELPYGTQALPVKTPMKVLVMISSPDGYPPLDVEEEWRRLNRALQPLIDRGLVLLKRLEHPTLSALQQQLRREQTHIFHFIGHGKYFERQQDGMLLLEDEDRRGRPTSGQHLGAILHDHHTLRLVVLNACEGARTSAEDPYTGVAQTLVRQGIPAVLAMQFEIFENAAVTLAQEFYGAIADGYPVDAALSEARKAIFAGGNDVEWGTPVLFMRIPNGVLFRPETAAEKAARQAAEQRLAEKAARERAEREAKEKRAREQRASLLNGLYAQAKNQMAQQDWTAAVDSLAQIRGIEPDYLDTVVLLGHAEAEKDRADQVADMLVQGREMCQDRDWRGAIPLLQQLLILAPGHEEAQQLLADAQAQVKEEHKRREQQAQLTRLYDRAHAKMAKRDWAGAEELLQKIFELEPGFRDAKDLLKQAQAERAALQEAERQAEEKRTQEERVSLLNGLYEQARNLMAQQDWPAAVDQLARIRAIEPGFRDAPALLEQAKTESERASKAAAFLTEGKRLIQGRDWAQAIPVLEQLLALAPGHDEARQLLAGAQAQLKGDQERQEREARLAALYEQAKSKLAQQDCAGAVDSLAQIRGIEPGFRDATSLLAQAEAERERAARVAGFLAQAREMIQSRNWAGAIPVLEQLLALVPGHQEAQKLLANARVQLKQEQERREREAQVAGLYEQARAKMAERDWAGAGGLLEKIDRIEPGFRDARDLLKQARVEKDRRDNVARLAARGREHLAKSEWGRAAGVFKQALTLDPANSEVQALMAQAERGERVQALFEAAQKDLRAGRLLEGVAGLEEVLKLEPGHAGAAKLAADARARLKRAEEEVRKPESKPEPPADRPAKPLSFPEEITTPRRESAPQETRPRSKPDDLPR